MSPRTSTSPKAKPSFDSLPDGGYVRFSQLVPAVVPASRSTLWRWVKARKFPAPAKLSDGVTAWRVGDVRAFLAAQEGGTK